MLIVSIAGINQQVHRQMGIEQCVYINVAFQSPLAMFKTDIGHGCIVSGVFSLSSQD